MSLIIEGHSKVKTYGQGTPDDMHNAKIVAIDTNPDPVIRKVQNMDDNGHEMVVKHLHTPPNPKKETKIVDNKKPEKNNSPMDSLLSFLDTSFGGFLGTKDNESGESSSEEEDGSQNGLTYEKEIFRKVRSQTY